MTFVLATMSAAAPALASTNTAESNPANGFSFSSANPAFKNQKELYLELKPGDTFTDQVTAKNLGDTPATFEVYAVPSGYDKNLNMRFLDKNAPKILESAWISFDQNTFTLGPNQEKTFNFTISVPKDAQLSENYNAGITLEKSLVQQSSQAKIKTKGAIVLPVYLNVTNHPKPLPGDFQANLLKTTKTPTFWFSFALFVLGIAYYIEGRHKEKQKKLKELKEKRD